MVYRETQGAVEQAAHIAVRGLVHEYASARQTLTALSGVDLDVDEGEFVSIIGASGGGKTTLLKAIGGLLEPNGGSVQVAGVPPHEAQCRKAIGFVFQDPSLLPWRTVAQNIDLPLRLNSQDGDANGSDAERMLETVGLAEFSDYYPHQLSAGMRQRVALARALVFGPAVLLMDEPLAALDEITRAAMRYELLRLWDGSRMTVAMVTHSIHEAVIMSDRVVVLSSRPGRVVHQVSIDLPRPREESLEMSGRFLDYANEIREALSQEEAVGARAVEAAAGV